MLHNGDVLSIHSYALKHGVALEEIDDAEQDHPRGAARLAHGRVADLMTNYGMRKDGTPVTEADVRAWADEAERGYDLAALRESSERESPAGGGGHRISFTGVGKGPSDLAERAEEYLQDGGFGDSSR